MAEIAAGGTGAAMCLRGHALVRAGRAEEGRALIETGRLLPLGNAQRRHSVAGLLEEAGLEEEALAEREFIVRTGGFGDWHTGNSQTEVAHALAKKGRCLRAAQLRELSMLECLKSNTSFLETTACLLVPYWVHLNRARGLLAAGRKRECLKEAELCLAAMPGEIDLALDLVPDLEKHGMREDADRIFSKVLAVHEKVLAEHPRAAGHHNSLAWACARTGRELKKARAHAEKAVELEPDEPAYVDTLAEVFRRSGDMNRSLELMRRAVKLSGGGKFYRERLEEFEREAKGPTK
jgi:tetratricopeptide (TPR) repeat protein